MPADTLRSSALGAYEELAPLYDRFTAHHDYQSWTATLEGLALKHNLSGSRLLDVACGTGKSFAPFAARGYHVTACDLSPAMVERARERPGVAPERVFVTDMRELPVVGRFDLVLCLDDALNYLLSPADVRRAIAGMAANLRPGGIAVFDVNTLHAYRSAFTATSWTEDAEVMFLWRGEPNGGVRSGARFAATLEAFRRGPDGRFERSSSRHVQRHHPMPVLDRLLREDGFEEVRIYGQFPDGSVEDEADEERHTKFVYVARRGAEIPDQERR